MLERLIIHNSQTFNTSSISFILFIFRFNHYYEQFNQEYSALTVQLPLENSNFIIFLREILKLGSLLNLQFNPHLDSILILILRESHQNCSHYGDIFQLEEALDIRLEDELKFNLNYLRNRKELKGLFALEIVINYRVEVAPLIDYIIKIYL